MGENRDLPELASHAAEYGEGIDILYLRSRRTSGRLDAHTWNGDIRGLRGVIKLFGAEAEMMFVITTRTA